MKKKIFLFLFVFISAFAFAKEPAYNLEEDFQIGMDRTTFEYEVERLGWTIVEKTSVSYTLAKANEYFSDMKVNLISVAFTDDKLSVFSIVFLPNTTERALFIDYLLKFSMSNYAKLVETYENPSLNGINYRFTDKKGYSLTFTIPNTDKSDYYAITCSGKKRK